MLQQLGLRQMAASLAAGTARTNAARPSAPRQRRANLPVLLPTRRSSRAQGLPPPEAAPVDDGAALGGRPASSELAELSSLLTMREFFDLNGFDVGAAIPVDGKFRGEIAPRVAEKFGISSSGACESGGAKAPAVAAKGKGWSGAKAWAATQFRTNPAAYFYRHGEPPLLSAFVLCSLVR